MKSIIIPELSQALINSIYEIDDEKIYHHIVRVFRSKKSEKILLLNGMGLVATGSIVEILKNSIKIEVAQIKQSNDIRKFSLAVGISKRDNFELILRSAIECNVKSIIPCMTEYSSDPFKERIFEINNGEIETSERIKKIIESAMIQSNNSFYPDILAPVVLSSLAKANQSMLAWLEPTAENLQSKINTKNYTGILIGPEGGFSTQERNYIANNFSIQTIHGPIMRADTCVTFGLGFLNGLC